MKRSLPPIHWSIPALLIALIAYCGILHAQPGWRSTRPFKERCAAWTTPCNAWLKKIDGIDCDWDEGRFRASTPENGLAFRGFALPSVSHVVLQFEPRAPFDYQDFVLFYEPSPGGPPQMRGTASVEYEPKLVNSAETAGQEMSDDPSAHDSGPPPIKQRVSVIWHLPSPITSGWFRLPPHADFRFLRLEMSMDLQAQAAGKVDYMATLAKWLMVAGVALLVLLLVQRVRPGFQIDAVLVKKVLLVGLIPAYAIMIFLLPPFQGPDEFHHWKHALQRCRPNALHEVCLYNLYEIVGAERLPHRTDNQLPPQLLRADPGERQPAGELETHVTYGTWFSHPFVWLIAAWFPRVETVREALFFFYLCRTLPIIVLFAILWIANQKGLLPYMGILFFSLPLVMEQMMVVSSDTVPNLGTLLAVLVFQAAWRVPRWWMVAVLWFLATAITLAKPPIYVGVFLLPLLATPWQAVPYKRFWVPITLAGLVAGGYFAWQYGLELTHRGQDPTEEKKQIDRMNETIEHLQSKHGRHHFEQLCKSYLLAIFESWPRWYQPLGWLDTALSNYHKGLIALSLWTVLFFDLLYFSPNLLASLLGQVVVFRRLLRGAAGHEEASAWQLSWWFVRDYVWLFVVIGVVAVNFLIIGVVDCLINYIIYSKPWEETIWGVQLRYFFPVGILAIFLPLSLLSKPPALAREGTRAGWLSRFAATAALSLLPLLWLARQVELTIDLLTRYW